MEIRAAIGGIVSDKLDHHGMEEYPDLWGKLQLVCTSTFGYPSNFWNRSHLRKQYLRGSK